MCSETILPVASPSLLKRFSIRQPSDLIEAPLLHLATRPKLWSEWFQTNDCGGTNAFHGNRFDQFNMIIEAAVAGMGFALLPRYLIEEDLKSAALKIVVQRPMSTDNNYYLVTPEGRRENPAAKDFQQWLLAQVTERLKSSPS
jgi:LysR family glycine cleavage system transcriptional activator